MQNSDVDDYADYDDYADCDDDEDNVSMKMLKSATWHQAFHCVKETLDGVDDDIDSGDDDYDDAGDDDDAKHEVERYDLAAKCYRQALNCVKETPALGEREKASKTQEIQVTIVRALQVNLVSQGLLKELRTKVTESDLGEDEAGEEVAGSQAAGTGPERPCIHPQENL